MGLARTKTLQDYTSSRKELRHSPFCDGNVLYPFLILEAKSEVRGPGFHSIETQIAVPIITLMKLQENLSKVSGNKLKPLVWFLAYMGDLWRVYASVSDGPTLVCYSCERPSTLTRVLKVFSELSTCGLVQSAPMTARCCSC